MRIPASTLTLLTESSRYAPKAREAQVQLSDAGARNRELATAIKLSTIERAAAHSGFLNLARSGVTAVVPLQEAFGGAQENQDSVHKLCEQASAFIDRTAEEIAVGRSRADAIAQTVDGQAGPVDEANEASSTLLSQLGSRGGR